MRPLVPVDPGYMDGEVGTATDSERVRIRQDNRCSLGTWTTGVRVPNDPAQPPDQLGPVELVERIDWTSASWRRWGAC